MPGGICAISSPMSDFRAAARCGLVTIRVFGLTRTLSLGGYAEAYFPDKEQSELSSLNAGETITVEWERAVFRGHDWLLGDIAARLNPQRHSGLATSLVTSLSVGGQGSFFPAVNKNYLSFSFHLPRFGITLVSDEPIINEAEIDQIPPYGAVYELERPVQYKAAGKGLLSGIFAPTVEKCAVKLVELKHIVTDLLETSRDGAAVTYAVTFRNETTEDRIQIAWMVWPEEADAELPHGVIWLNRDPARVEIEVPTPALATQRWLAAAIASPFHTDAASIVQFPLM